MYTNIEDSCHTFMDESALLGYNKKSKKGLA